MKVGFTGTREGMTPAQLVSFRLVFDLLRHRQEVEEAHHGDCVGSDDQFDEEARAAGVSVVLHPPLIRTARAFCDRRGPTRVNPQREYLDRNARIVQAVDALFAAPKGPEEARSGTWFTVRQARKAGKPVALFHPNGAIEFEGGFINYLTDLGAVVGAFRGES